MNRKTITLIRSAIFIFLFIALMSAYTLAPVARSDAPALSLGSDPNGLSSLLNHFAFRFYRALAATPINDEYPDANEDTDLIVPAPGILGNDSPADPVTAITVVTGPTSGVLTGPATDGSFTYDPDDQFEDLGTGETATEIFTYTVTDNEGTSAEATVTITVNGVNDAPVIAEGESTTVNMSEDGSPTPFSLTLNATDVDGDTLTWSISAPASHGTASASGTGPSKAIGYTPDTNYNGPDSFVVQVSDGNLTDTVTVNVNIEAVNSSPIIAEGASATVNMSEDGVPTAFGLILNATDVDGDTLTWSISAPASHGTASASGTGPSKAIGYTPDTNYNGTDSFVVQVSDGNGGMDTILVNVNIEPVNDPPVITQGTSTTVNMSEDGVPTAFGLTLNSTDVDGDTLTWSISSPASHGMATASGGGGTKAIGYTPDPNYHGTDSFVVQVSDGNLTDTILVNVNIASVNDPPTNITLSNSDIDENMDVGSLVGTLATTDVDVGDVHTYFNVLAPGYDSSSFAIVGNQLITSASFNYEVKNSYTIRIKTNDDKGGTFEKDFIITVNDVNEAPSGLSDPYEVNLGETLIIPAPGVLANDSDTDGDAITAVKLTNPAHGTLIFLSNGSFTYTPTGSFTGEDTFLYQVEDAAGLTSPPIEVVINVKDAFSPSVVWMEPVGDGGQMDVNGEVILLSVEATDDVAIDYVQFYRWVPNDPPPGGVYVDIAIDNEPPFEVSLSTNVLIYEFNQIFAQAYDNAGNESGRKFIWLYRLPPTEFLFFPLVNGK